MLKAKGLVKSYGKRRVLNGIDLQVSPREMLGILGPNGSGKSTLIRLISGEEAPDEGTVWLNGSLLKKYSLRQKAQQIAVVPQNGVKGTSVTVEDYLLMGREPYQNWWPWYDKMDRVIVNQWMVQMDLNKDRYRFIHRLSGGERQRVAIAQAMVQEPKVLLLDEPTNHLDLKYQLQILTLLKQLKEELKIAIVIVLHDVNLAAQYCDHLLFLKKGKLIKYGNPRHVLSKSLIYEVYDIDPFIIEHPELSVPQILLSQKEDTR